MSEILLIHHSVGRGILRHGRVRRRMSQLAPGESVRLWDHDYNWRGVHGPDGRRVASAFPIPNNDTTPAGYLRFLTDVESNSVLTQRLSRFRAVVIKSCFPNSRIASGSALRQLQQTYRDIAARLRDLGTMPCLITTPPIRAGRIAPDQAHRAAELAAWLTSEGPFEATFDLFAALADIEPTSAHYGMLRPENANHLVFDSHPNVAASRRLGDPVARFLLGIGRPADRPISDATGGTAQ